MFVIHISTQYSKQISKCEKFKVLRVNWKLIVSEKREIRNQYFSSIGSGNIRIRFRAYGSSFWKKRIESLKMFIICVTHLRCSV